tara:strand:+ start:62 stop:268 length:207 start_codon:yes stop_codon:yes gene_type:complete
MEPNIIDNPETDLQDGIMYKKITHEYVLDLYDEIKRKKITDEEREKQLAVVDVLSDHIGEFMILKCEQ